MGAESEEFRVTVMQKCCEAFAELLGGLWVISVGSCELFAQKQSTRYEVNALG